MSLTIGELERFVAELAGAPEHWRHLVRHADHARVYELIWEDEQVNAWMICWSQDQDTGFHDHDVSAAAIGVISDRFARTGSGSATCRRRARSGPGPR